MAPITEQQIERARRAELMRHQAQQDAADKAAERANESFAAHYDALLEALNEEPQRQIPTPGWYSASPHAIGRRTASALDVAYEHICADGSPEWAAMVGIVVRAAKGGDEQAQQWIAKLCSEHAAFHTGEQQ